MPSRRRLNSLQRLEREKRKQYEKERPEFGGFIWEAILIGLLGCLFCAGKDFEENVEKARAVPRNIVEGVEGDIEEVRHRHHHARGRSRTNRSRSISDGSRSSERGTHRDGGNGSGYVGYEGQRGGARDDAITYIPADEERYRGNGGVLGRYAENQDVYNAESPAPRRRRTRRGESYN